jgi:PTS system nitrogen regulatory IIA component
MPWTDLLVAERIVVLDDPGSPARMLEAAAGLLAGGPGPLADAIAQGLQSRERLGSTAIGHGIAIPHARGEGFPAARGAFLRLGRALDFGARDGAPVDLVLALCAPDDEPDRHLQHLAEIAAHFADPGFRERLRAARGAAALRRLLLSRPPASAAA